MLPRAQPSTLDDGLSARGAGQYNIRRANRSLQINCHHGTRSLSKGLCSRGAAVPDSEICVRITRTKSLHQRPAHSTRPNNQNLSGIRRRQCQGRHKTITRSFPFGD